MNKFLLLTCLLLAFESQSCTIPFADKKGIEMFLESEFRSAYWPLSQYYESQINGTYCGVASAVMVLNALNIPRPFAWPNDNVKLFTQANFFSEAVLKVVDHDAILEKGMSLHELARAISAWGVQTKSLYASNLTEQMFREFLKNTLVQTDRFIIANYYRPLIQGVYGGHFSPIAAYDQKTDSLLLLDVYRHEFTSTWIEVPKFLEAMQKMSTESGLSRGLILIQK